MALAVSLLAAVAVQLRSRLEAPALVACAVLAPLVAGLVWTAGELAGVSEPWVALVALLLLSLLALSAPAVAGSREPFPLELGTFAAGVVVGVVGVTVASSATAADWAAVYLTVGGTAATLVALLRSDRRQVGWLGGAAAGRRDLGAAGGPRRRRARALHAAVGRGAPGRRCGAPARDPPVVAPSGARRRARRSPWCRRCSGCSTSRCRLRALLLGLACLALVVAGAPAALGAPLAARRARRRSCVVLREAGPYVGDSVPRWALIGAAGALLIALGVTWEQRLADARAVTGVRPGLR